MPPTLQRTPVAVKIWRPIRLQTRSRSGRRIFCEGDLGLIYTYRRVGKHGWRLGVSKALSEGGTSGPWRAHQAVKVLYIDGEMPAELIRERGWGLRRGEDEVEFLNHEILFDRTQKVLNITDREVQEAITGYCLERNIKVWLS